VGWGLGFQNTSTAGEANIIILSPGYCYFGDNSSAGSANIEVYDSGSLGFGGHSSAGNATITILSFTDFNGSSTAGGASISVVGVALRFLASSSGGTAQIELRPFKQFGALEIDGHNSPGRDDRINSGIN
jgi:hypothetical protein